MRIDGRTPLQMRNVKITCDVAEHAEGSALIEFGSTRVLCTATVDEATPKWLNNSGKGWVTAEYSMLPRSTHTRIRRDKALTGGRSQEISRLIGRSLRACVNMKGLSEKQIIVDCDVINADGGTRTAAITGGFVALALALKKLQNSGVITSIPITHYMAAVSVGYVEGNLLLDLCYEEDSRAETDMNFVFVDSGNFVEVQGTAEQAPFSRDALNNMVDLAHNGCRELFKAQNSALKHILPLRSGI